MVEGNIAHHNQDTGIEVRSNNTLLRHNQSWSNQDHGFDHLYSTNNTHVGDLAWGNNRDGMSFENHSHNHTIRNCVIANNGRDRSRNDAELEFDNSAIYNLTSDYNVIWRDFTPEPADSIILNLKGGTSCSSDSCFGTLARFQAAFTSLEQHSRSGQPTFTDSSAGNFVPLSSSSVLDGATSDATGYVALDLRGYYRHDAQAKEPNTGSGSIDYADIGPYEWDVAESPTAPSIACYRGRYDAAINWTSTQYNGDESSRYYVLKDGHSIEAGVPAPSGVPNCVYAPDLSECTHYTFTTTIINANTGYYSSSVCTLTTKCSGNTFVYCGDGLVGGGGEESVLAELEGAGFTDEPRQLEIRIATLGPGRSIHYAIPRELAGAALDLSVFDVAGRRVLTVIQGLGRAGRFTADLPRSRHGLERSGVYFVRLRAGAHSLRKTLVLW